TSKFRVETRMTKAESRPCQFPRARPVGTPIVNIQRLLWPGGNPARATLLRRVPECRWTWDDSESGHTRRFTARMFRGAARSKLKYQAARHAIEDAALGELLQVHVRLNQQANS